MRRAMICVCFMLALLQLWPMVFGGSSDAGAAVAASPAAVTAPVAPRVVRVAATRAATPVAGARPRPAALSMPSCYQLYERAFAQCGSGNPACQLKTGDHWDVCEATGFWPS